MALKANKNLGLSSKLKVAFPDVSPVARPTIKDQEIQDPNWVAGFTAAEGCFFVQVRKSKTHSTGFQVLLVFALIQDERDEQLMRCFIKYLDCGRVEKKITSYDYRVTKFLDIVDKVIPFFKKHKIEGVKAQDFEDFCKVAELMKEKKHLTKEGFEQIRQIKAQMNRKRKSY